MFIPSICTNYIYFEYYSFHSSIFTVYNMVGSVRAIGRSFIFETSLDSDVDVTKAYVFHSIKLLRVQISNKLFIILCFVEGSTVKM